MATISAAPDILRVADGEYWARGEGIAAGAINRGDVVYMNSSGLVAQKPTAADAVTNHAIGVALDAAAANQPVAYVIYGTVTVYNDSTTNNIAVGSMVEASTNFAGAVMVAAAITDTSILGPAIDAIPASGSGRIILRPR